MSEVTEQTTADDVVTAEAAAREAEGLARDLEERFKEGDESVTPDVIEAQESVSRFAKYAVERARRKVEKAREAARQVVLADIKARADALADDRGTKASELLRAAVSAINAFESHLKESNLELAGLRQEAAVAGVQVGGSASAESGFLKITPPFSQVQFVSGDREFKVLPDGRTFLTNLLNSSSPEAFYETLENVDGAAK